MTVGQLIAQLQALLDHPRSGVRPDTEVELQLGFFIDRYVYVRVNGARPNHDGPSYRADALADAVLNGLLSTDPYPASPTS